MPKLAPELHAAYLELANEAFHMCDMAYAPYSTYHVGAALLTDDGQIIGGCNVENAMSNLGVCAERAALIKAVSEGYRNFSAIAVATRDGQECTPCGSCRQALWEFSPDMTIIAGTGNANNVNIACYTLRQLFPKPFGADSLTK